MSHAEALRTAPFRGHGAWAVWGRFSARLEEEAVRFGPWTNDAYEDRNQTCPVVCGVCGLSLPDAEAKAHHLRADHGAEVRSVRAPWGESVYEWTRQATGRWR